MKPPENVAMQLWLAHLHFWGAVVFGVMAATSAAAVVHHLERAGAIEHKPRVLLEAEEAMRRA